MTTLVFSVNVGGDLLRGQVEVGEVSAMDTLPGITAFNAAGEISFRGSVFTIPVQFQVSDNFSVDDMSPAVDAISIGFQIDGEVSLLGQVSTGNTSLLDASIGNVSLADFDGGGSVGVFDEATLSSTTTVFSAFTVTDGGGQVSVPVSNDDLFEGTNGPDQFNGGAGNDTIIGLRGNDTFTGGSGRDEIFGNGGRDVLIGNGGRDRLEGGGGRDDLKGGGGRDMLNGGGGRDTVDGQGGRDLIEGGGGRDDIIGGRGSDTLTGNGGADRFIFQQRDGRDFITDFQQSRDKIVITEGADDLSGLRIAQFGDDVRITFANTRITVEDDEVANFTAADFIF